MPVSLAKSGPQVSRPNLKSHWQGHGIVTRCCPCALSSPRPRDLQAGRDGNRHSFQLTASSIAPHVRRFCRNPCARTPRRSDVFLHFLDGDCRLFRDAHTAQRIPTELRIEEDRPACPAHQETLAWHQKGDLARAGSSHRDALTMRRRGNAVPANAN